MNTLANESHASRGSRAALSSAIALAAFLCATSAIAALAPVPDRHDLNLKIEYLDAHADEYDALAVGSSRVYRSIVPRAVEEALALHGEHLRIYNLGFPGAEPYEADYYLRRALAARDSWQLVLVEAWREVREDGDEEAFTLRRVHWHVLPRALDAIRACLRRERLPFVRRLEEVRVHALLFALRLTSYGRGVEILDALGSELAPAEVLWLASGAGYRALEEDPITRAHVRRNEYLADPDIVLRTAAELERDLAGEPDSDGLDLELVREQVEVARSTGATVVFLVAPGNPRAVSVRALSEVAPHVLSYQSPSAHPFLHDPALRFDANHLVHDAAVRFSLVLGRDLAEILASESALRAHD